MSRTLIKNIHPFQFLNNATFGDLTAANVYNKTEVDALISNVHFSSYYTKAQTNDLLGLHLLCRHRIKSRYRQCILQN
jgi:hypothetical protein